MTESYFRPLHAQEVAHRITRDAACWFSCEDIEQLRFLVANNPRRILAACVNGFNMAARWKREGALVSVYTCPINYKVMKYVGLHDMDYIFGHKRTIGSNQLGVTTDPLDSVCTREQLETSASGCLLGKVDGEPIISLGSGMRTMSRAEFNRMYRSIVEEQTRSAVLSREMQSSGPAGSVIFDNIADCIQSILSCRYLPAMIYTLIQTCVHGYLPLEAIDWFAESDPVKLYTLTTKCLFGMFDIPPSVVIAQMYGEYVAAAFSRYAVRPHYSA